MGGLLSSGFLYGWFVHIALLTFRNREHDFETHSVFVSTFLERAWVARAP